MNELLPRLGWVLPADEREAKRALETVVRELVSAPTVHIIIIGAAERVRRLAGDATLHPLDATRVADGLQAARSAEALPLLDRGSDPGLAAAERFVSEHVIDGYLLFDPLPAAPCIHVRHQASVVQPFPAASLRWLLDQLPARELARCLERANAALRRLGSGAPRLVVFELEGSASLAEAMRIARGGGLDVLGPYPPSRAVQQRADALVAFTPAQLELPLALQGTGPCSVLALDRPCAWPTESGSRSALLTVERLLKLLPPEGGQLAAQREEARKPTVSVAKKVRGVGAAPDTDRCPYCHLRLGESPDGTGARPGPPVSCSECGTPHHRDCASEHGRCTTLGCAGTRVLRLGVAIPLTRLGGESPREHRFATLDGDTRLGPQTLRVEAPIDDPDARPTRRRLSVELASTSVRRGDWLEGYVVVWAPRPFRVRGGAIKLRASLTTTKLTGNKAVRTEPILGRQATFVGDAPAGALGRLQDGVVSLFSKGTGVAIPAGVRRYPFSFSVDAEHPASVRNRLGDVEETVTTALEVSLDTDTCQVSVQVT